MTMREFDAPSPAAAPPAQCSGQILCTRGSAMPKCSPAGLDRFPLRPAGPRIVAMAMRSVWQLPRSVARQIPIREHNRQVPLARDPLLPFRGWASHQSAGLHLQEIRRESGSP